MKKIRKAVIPAAGFGTRFLPATKATPKEMLPIVDKPTIQYIVEEALASGVEEILIISGHAKRAIEDHFDTTPGLEQHLEQAGKTEMLNLVREISDINIHYIRQKHMRGLGDAILCARSFIDNEPFAVLLGDDVVYNETRPALQQMIDVFNDVGGTILGCQEVEPEKVSAYGIVSGTPVAGKIFSALPIWLRSRLLQKRPAVRPCWAAISLHLTYSVRLSRRSPGRAEKYSLRTH